jgi:replication factor A1
LSGIYDDLVGLFQGTQIQATMFNEAAKKFFDRFQLGKVYYISKGTLKLANKQFKTVKNDYEMTLNENSEVEEASNEETFVPETKFSFVPIDQLGPYVNEKELVGKILLLPYVLMILFFLFLYN